MKLAVYLKDGNVDSFVKGEEYTSWFADEENMFLMVFNGDSRNQDTCVAYYPIDNVLKVLVGNNG